MNAKTLLVPGSDPIWFPPSDVIWTYQIFWYLQFLGHPSHWRTSILPGTVKDFLTLRFEIYPHLLWDSDKYRRSTIWIRDSCQVKENGIDLLIVKVSLYRYLGGYGFVIDASLIVFQASPWRKIKKIEETLSLEHLKLQVSNSFLSKKISRILHVNGFFHCTASISSIVHTWSKRRSWKK